MDVVCQAAAGAALRSGLLLLVQICLHGDGQTGQGAGERACEHGQHTLAAGQLGDGVGLSSAEDLALQEAGVFLCNYLWQLDISLDIANVSWGNLLETGGLAFWAFLVIFVIKTIVTLIYNYTTRKLIIFKAPKEEQVENEKAAPAASETTAPTYSDPSTRPCTPESLQKIVHEELLSYYGKSQLVISEDEARSLMKEELDRFWKSHPSTRK